jgi:membrane protein
MTELFGRAGVDLEIWGQSINFLISFGLTTLLFALIYRILPDVDVAWRDVWVGASITAVLFTVGKLLIGLYLGNAAVGSSYGAAASLVVVMLWVYYSAQILFLGAEFTQVYSRLYGSRQEEAALVVAPKDKSKVAARPKAGDAPGREGAQPVRQESRR